MPTDMTPPDTDTKAESPRAAVILDRDDTLTLDRGYTWKVEDFVWMPGAPEALALFHRHAIRQRYAHLQRPSCP